MPLRHLPIQKKLLAIMLTTSGAALLLTCAGLFAYEFFTFRQTMVRQFSTVAAIISGNSTAVLAFEDRKAAIEILSALKAEPQVLAASLYDNKGELFSTYPDGSLASAFPDKPDSTGYRFESTHLTIFKPVVQGDKHLGTLYLKSDMQAMSTRFRLYAGVAGVVAALSFLLAYLLSKALQGQITKPILYLAETARAVSLHRNYSVRAKKLSSDELGLLTDAFNQMLTHIQEQLTRMELLNHITRAIGERADLPSIFQVMVRTLEDHFPVDFGCVCLYDATQSHLTLTGVGLKSQDLASQMGMDAKIPIPVDPNGLARCVRGELVYEPDIRLVQSPFSQKLAGHGLRSLVISPLIVESKVFGVLIVARHAPESFGSMECEFLRQLSEHAALASHQAHLYNALQTAYEELRQSQQAAMQQERLRALGQMASGIAHDINNAISPAYLYTEFLLENESDLSPRARDQVQIIGHAIEDVAATVARMREFSRHREPDMTLVKVQLNRSIQQVIDLTRVRWNDMPQQQGIVIQIKTDFCPDLPEILGVEGEVREALTNLFLNAFDAMPNGGTLTLRTRKADETKVHLEVSDTGTGMDEETRRHCLEPFYTTKGERGTGLGLAMVYGVAKRHGALVEIESQLGSGTLIRLVFPIPAASDENPAPNAEVSQILPPLRILLIDDDTLILKSLANILSEDGHTVVTANTGHAGINTFLDALKAGNAFEIVITDLGMPYMDGRKVAAQIKAASPATPVLLLTGWGQRLLEDGDIPPHVSQVLSKPPKPSKLREAIAQSLAHARVAPHA